MSIARRLLIGGGTIGLIFCCLWAVTDSESFGQCIHQHKNYHAYHALHEKSGYFVIAFARVRLHLACGFIAAHENGEAIVGLGTLAIAAFTGILWLVTWGMGQIARNQHSILERQTEISTLTQAAFVYTGSFSYFWLHHPDNEQKIVMWRFIPAWNNTGSLVARNVVIDSNWSVFVPDITDDFDFPHLETEWVPKSSIIGPRDAINGGRMEVPIHILVVAKRGACNIYLWGWSEYPDSFNKDVIRRTEFCNRIIVNGNPRFKDCVFTFEIHHRHNGTDGDCYRSPGQVAPLREAPLVEILYTPEEVTEFNIPVMDDIKDHDT